MRPAGFVGFGAFSAAPERAGPGRPSLTCLGREEHCAGYEEDSEMSSGVENLNQKLRQEYNQNALGGKGSTRCSKALLKHKYELVCVQTRARKCYFYKIIARSWTQ